MRDPEGIETHLPGKSSESPWSKHREPDIRNVEAVGSNPITSTKGPGQRPESGVPKIYGLRYVTLRDLIGERNSESAPCGDLIISVHLRLLD